MDIHISLHDINRALHRTYGAFAQTLNTLALDANDAHHMHRAFEELSALSDIERQDIGMMRSDSRAVVTHVPARSPPIQRASNQPARPAALAWQCAAIGRSQEKPNAPDRSESR